MTVAEQLESPYRDDVIEKVIAVHVDQRQFAAARSKLHLIQGDEARNRSRILVERESHRPSLDDPLFIEKHVAWAMETIRERFEETRKMRSILNPEKSDDALPDEAEQLVQYLAEAMWAHHRGDRPTCRENLQACYEAATAMEDADMRMFEVLSVGCFAHQFGEKKLAREILLDFTQIPESDEYYLGATAFGLKPMHVLADVMSNSELEPLIARWKEAEFPIEIVAFPVALAKRGEFDRVDWLYHKLDSCNLRLAVCSIAITELVKQPAE
jgi:hypothetical protein